jgi:autotransporter-associated beta strand protein
MIQRNVFLAGMFRLILLLAGLAFALNGNATDRYVSTTGNDTTGNGTIGNPYKTITKGFSVASAGDIIQVRGGTYRETVALVNKSGSAGAPITLASYTNESAILSGLDVKTLTWTTNSGMPNVWVATYTGGAFEQMFVDGKPMLEARWPNVPLDTNGNWNFFSSNCWATVDTNGNSYGTVSDVELAATGWNITGWRAVLNVSHQYYTWTRVVTNHTAGSAIFNYPQDLSGVSLTDSFNDDRYYLVGNTNLLDTPGEWCYDANSQRLYYYPVNGKNPNTALVEIKARNYSFTADKNSKYLTVDGITFFGTAFEFGTSVDNRSANIIFRNNQVLYSSWTEWLNMTNGDPNVLSDENFPMIQADNSLVVNNTFAYGALNAVFVYGWTNRFVNNVIHDFDLSSSLQYPPLQFGRSWLYDIGKNGQGIARFNTLYNSGGILAQIGGTNIDVSQNDLYNAFRACWGGNKDTAALYISPQKSSGAETNFINNRFHHNWVHEGYSGAPNPSYGGGIGIRGDDQTSGQTMDHNVTWNLGGCGVQIKNVTNPIPALANACVNNTIFNYHTLYTATNGAIYLDNIAGGNENALSSAANNLADSLYGNWGARPIGTLALNASNSIGMLIETNLENIGWYDFRPQAGAASILNRGISFTPTTTNWVGSAPDIGAYERGDSIYFIPGQRATNATFPIVPDGAVGVPVTRDVLMWRPAYNAASHAIYFGSASNALASYGTVSGETNVFTLPALSANTNYYWRVDAVLTNSTVITGAVWSFSTWPNSTNWDGGGADTNWSTLANWNPDGLPAQDGSAILSFSGTARTNNYNNFPTNTVFAGMNFLNTTAGQSFTLSGNPITLGGNIVTTVAGGTINDSNSIPMLLNGDRTVTANTSHNLSLSGIISDDSAFTPRSLTKDGAAVLTLSATNTYSGSFSINGGTVSVNSLASSGVSCAIGAGSVINLANGSSAGTLTLTGNNGATVNRTINFNLAGGNGGGTIQNSSGAPLIFNGTFISGSGGTRTLNLGGSSGSTVTNDFQSPITENGASTTTLLMNSGNVWKLSNDGNNFLGQLQLSSGMCLITSITNYGVACSIGRGTFGTVIRIGNINQADGILNYIGSGASCNRQIQIGNGNGLAGAGILNNGSGALIFTTNAFNQAAGANTTAGSRTLMLGGANTNANEIRGAIRDNTASVGSVVNFTKVDSGTWVLSGTNTYTGATTVSNGTLLVNSPGSLAAGSAVAVQSGAILGGNGTIGGVATFNSGSHALLTNGATLALTNSLIIAASGTIPDVILNLSNNVPAGTYTLATYNPIGSSGAFNSVVGFTNSGSFAANTTNYITTAGGQVNLVVLNLYTLNYAASANGSISGSTNQVVASGGSGSAVTAVPAAGYHFVNWSDSSTANPRMDTNVGANLNITANFAANTYTLTYNAGANGTISGITPQTVAYLNSGSQVIAIPNTGYHFTSWSDGVLTSNRTDMARIGGTNVTASFAINTYVLTYNAVANGSVSGTSPQTVNYNTSGSPVYAAPLPGYHFVSWSDGLATTNRTDANVISNITVTASFGINSYTLTYNAGNGGFISGTTPQTVVYLTSGAPVTAVASNGYAFTSWSDGVSTSNRIDTVLIGGTNVTAIFALSAPSPAFLTNAILNGNQLVLNWPAGQGWTLQIQTNDLVGGLSTNWSTVILPASVPPYTNPINPASPAVFYRLKY